ncbi:hypothetical protein JTB14_017486 [Gonioctena quinquepunctata]|nr:hypothetical protein JTB14_017486 [Gonioctena quinquepunctata]
MKSTKKKTIEEYSSSDSNVSVTLESEDDIFENGLVTAENEILSDDEVEANDGENEMDADDEANDEVLNLDRSEEKIKKCSWVLAKYGNASYVGRVVDIEGNKAETMFLRKMDCILSTHMFLIKNLLNLRRFNKYCKNPTKRQILLQNV